MQNKRVFSILMALTLSLSIVGCGMFMPAAVDLVDPEAASVDILTELTPNLTVNEVEEVWAEDSVVIVDVREQYEYDDGHIPGAVLIPLGEIRDRVDEIPSDVPVILVCRSGNRSGQAYQYLKQQGFTNVHNMLGGMVEWTAFGYEVEK